MTLLPRSGLGAPGVGQVMACIALLSVVLVSCDRDNGSPAAKREAGVAPCELLSEYEDVAELLDAPLVFSRTATELASILGDRAKLTQQLAEATGGTLRSDLHRLVEYRRAGDPVLVDAWTERKSELESVGGRWPYEALQHGVVVEGDRVSVGEMNSVARVSFEKLIVQCRAPELGRPPAQDQSVEIEAGHLVFNRPDRRGGALWRMETTGGSASRLATPEGWDDLSSPAVAPDGVTIAAVVRSHDTPATGVAIGSLSQPFEVVWQESSLSISCVAWAPDQRRIVATATDANGDSVFTSVGVDGGATVIEIEFREGSCAHYLDEERLAIDFVLNREGGDAEIVSVTTSGTGSRRLYNNPDCNEQIGRVSPSRPEIAIALACEDPTQNGVYVYNFETQSISRLLAGNVALPAWSPSGDWIAFGYAPLGHNLFESVSAWAIRRDGKGLRQITTPASSFPAWIDQRATVVGAESLMTRSADGP